MPSPVELSKDKQFEILHDHYKETFARMREVEASRESLLLWVIGLYALLSLEIGYPAATKGALGKLSIIGGELNLQNLPLPALLTATWVLTLAISLRYCQKSISVDRQYPYLHKLEEALSSAYGDDDLYRREGKVYLNNYPQLLNVTWFAYVVLFPILLFVATFALGYWEFTQLFYPLFFQIFDLVIVIALLIFFFLYRVQPFISKWWSERMMRKTKANPIEVEANLKPNKPTTNADPSKKTSGTQKVD